MNGLLTRRSFTLGLTAIVDLVARRWKLGFTVAEAKAAAPPSPPIAPVVPETFDEFGGVRIDHYDWLRDRRDPRVVAYLDAENAYADARLEPIKPLVDACRRIERAGNARGCECPYRLQRLPL
jgi:chorismate mutase